MAFEGLSEKLNATFKRLRGKGRLTENDVKEAMREVRLALLEADVGYKVVKDFVATVTERAIGTDVLDSLTPAQQVIKIVNEELTTFPTSLPNHFFPLFLLFLTLRGFKKCAASFTKQNVHKSCAAILHQYQCSTIKFGSFPFRPFCSISIAE